MANRSEVEAAQDQMLSAVNERRKDLGLVDMPEADAATRTQALLRLTPEQFVRLVHLPDEKREGELRALDAAERRRHVLERVWIDALSEVDDRPLYRWECSCGHITGRNYDGVLAAQAGWQRHSEGRGLLAGVAAPSVVASSDVERTCEGCGELFVPRWPRQKYHDDACRSRAWRNR